MTHTKLILTMVTRAVFFIFSVLMIGCGESVPAWKKDSINRYVSDYRAESSLWEKGEIAERISYSHWDEKKQLFWQETAERHKNEWRGSNCSEGFVSPEEKKMLSELPSRNPLSGNEWREASRSYSALYELCGNETYSEKYSKYSALSEFYAKTTDICGEVVHTYSGSVLASAIKKNYSTLSSMTDALAEELGDKAVKGYGECMCTMHNHFGVKDNISIGFCIGDIYHECKSAFCGATGDRMQIAKKLDGYRYKTPRGTSSYLSGGQVSSDLLEYGKRQTEALVQSYCSTNPNC